MDISILFVNYQSKNLIRQNLYALSSFRVPFSFEVIIVNNDPNEDVEQMVSLVRGRKDLSFSVTCIQKRENVGFAKGINAALKAGRGTYYLLLNPDIIITESGLEKLFGFMESHPKAGMAGPRLIQPDGKRQDSAFSFPSFFIPFYRRTFLKKTPWGRRALSVFLCEDQRSDNSPRIVDWIQGSCMLVRRKGVEDVGYMDERFFMYFEDTDWCRRFHQKGWEVWYVPQAVMVHYYGRWSAERKGIAAFFQKATWIHVFSWLYYFIKWRRKAEPVQGRG